MKRPHCYLLGVLSIACFPNPGLLEGCDGVGATTTEESGTEDDGETSESTGATDQECLEEIDRLAEIADAALAAFMIEQAGEPLHECPHPEGSPVGGEASITPELALDCNDGSEGRCVPSDTAGPAHYDPHLWTDNPIWAGLGFELTEPHCFHFNFIAINEVDGYGKCSFTAQAFGDLDGDSVFSTYSLPGVIDENGMMLGAMQVELGEE